MPNLAAENAIFTVENRGYHHMTILTQPA